MQEIWKPLALITFFLFLHIIRPYIKKLKVIDGLAWLPLLALLSTLALIPAYGFRPETIPLLLYSAVLTVAIFFKQLNGDIKFRNFRKRKIIFIFFPLVLLAAAGATAFCFTPRKNLSLSTHGVHAYGINDYSIRIYTDENDISPQRRPLLILLPPELGSLPAVDETAGKLRDLGFTVLTCARNNRINPLEFFRLTSAFFSGNSSAAANKRGRALEERRKEDIRFVLSWVRQNPYLYGTVQLFNVASRDAVFFAGYDTGGSALILLENFIEDFIEDFISASAIKVRALIAIEAPLWSLYAEEVNQIPEIPADASWFQSVKLGAYRWLMEIKPGKITGMTHIPELSVPTLFLISDWSRGTATGRQRRSSGTRPGRYDALFKCFDSARGQASLVSADGAGPLDYSDFPARYPIITFIMRGRSAAAWNFSFSNFSLNSPAWNADSAPAQSAAIITNFAESVFRAEEDESWRLGRAALTARIQIEKK